jgi:hypothetical protein
LSSITTPLSMDHTIAFPARLPFGRLDGRLHTSDLTNCLFGGIFSLMSEFEKFTTISQQEMDEAVRLSELVLPTDPQPVVGDDSSLHSVRSFEGHLHTAEEAVYTLVTRDTDEDGTDKLVAAKVSERDDDGTVRTILYTLVLNNGRFLVQRGIDDAEKILANEKKADNPYVEIERDTLEFELGLLAPEVNDWDNFIKLLEAPTNSADTVTKAGRLAQILGWLRK